MEESGTSGRGNEEWLGSPEWGVWLRHRLLEELRPLAWPPEQQVAYLQTGGVPAGPSALALSLDVLTYLINERRADSLPGQAEELGYLTSEQVDAIAAVDRQLHQMSGATNWPIWEEDALYDRPEWQEVRVLAKRALELLGDDPNLEHP